MNLAEKSTPLSEVTTTRNSTILPFVSVVVPGFNEEALIEKHLRILWDYMKTIEDRYRWELIFVNDGSGDNTGELANRFAETHENVKVLHHFKNFQLGQALRYAFNNCRGEYIVVMDLDLSYSPDHIERLLDAIQKSRAKIVIASPYMEGGQVSNVPWLRKFMSRWANRFLSLTAKGKLSTLTGMVRAYDAKFIGILNTKAMDMAINPEIIYKAQLLRGYIIEMPAHLSWSMQKSAGKSRSSSMKILWTILSSLFSGYLFRPFMFFILPGLAILAISLYPIIWSFIHTFHYYMNSAAVEGIGYHFSEAIAAAFQLSPHAFIVGGFGLMVSIQLISLGILSLQKKRYFEELFHLQSMRLKKCLECEHRIFSKL
ncbi:hypothetical protein D3OALGB2SA_2639 [Olavius algarvensis associated proteobacterium Delta 3]|nr:hypothetical protein D3OALGB2SA_2639 [Olavius algarvensis associated proteobacterium Delta 3]